MTNMTEEREHQELWETYWADTSSLKALEALVEVWSPLVVSVLERISIRLPAHVRMEDLLQAGMLGLCEAIERFDPDQKTTFRTFGYPRIRGAIIDELRREDHVPRSDRAKIRKVEEASEAWTCRHGRPPSEDELAAEAGLTVESMATLLSEAQPFLSLDDVVVQGRDGRDVLLRDVLSETTAVAPDEAAEKQDTLRILRMAFRLLSTREQKMLYLYYYEDMRLGEIASIFEVSEARICQIHALAVTRLRAAMQHMGYPTPDAPEVRGCEGEKRGRRLLA